VRIGYAAPWGPLENGEFRGNNFKGHTIAGMTGAAMAKLPQDLSILREKINQQRNTVDALKRDGHECVDAQRHLEHMLAELKARETDSTRRA
jgi:hypothetical protein